MNLSAPTKPLFLISIVLVVLAVVASLGVAIPVITANAFWVMLCGYAVLLAGNVLKGA